MKKIIYILLIILFVACATKTIERPVLDAQLHWWHKDLATDKIPGISLEKFYNENPKTPKKEIIVAVLDTHIDATHPELKDQIWTNTKEVPDNNIDDDKNGYIDDVNGWSFIGDKYGGYVVWANFEYTRIVRNFNVNFLQKGYDTILNKETQEFKNYQKAFKELKSSKEFYKNRIIFYKNLIELYPIALDSLKKYFTDNNYTNEDLRNLYKKNNNDTKLSLSKRLLQKMTDIASLSTYIYHIKQMSYTTEDLYENLIQNDSVYSKNCNENYDDRLLIGDNPEVLEKGYGNHKINNFKQGIRPFMEHSTMVSGIIAGNRKNNQELYGFSDQIKIMPLCISPSGDEHDKDIALAIYYAVDHGAKIINMSFSKDFSVNKKWVYEALQYAEKKNVLIVKSASNDTKNIDFEEIYPIDFDFETNQEIAQNMIVVGATNKQTDNSLVYKTSNYGKKNVDLFAPGKEIYVATYKDKYTTDGGTSLAAPMVSGTAALLWLYYPKLTVHEVKKIILESGTPIDFEVIKPGTEEKVPFSSLSKTGKILNVYNAMKMAEKY